MSDAALENAKALKAKALSEITRLEAELRGWHDRRAMADQFIDQWNAFASGEPVIPVESAPVEQNKPAPSPVKKKAIRNSKKEDVAEETRRIISERGTPVGRSDLFKTLIERGFTIEGTDPEMVLSTMLWRMRDRVARLKTGGYWLCEVPYEPEGYNPNHLMGALAEAAQRQPELARMLIDSHRDDDDDKERKAVQDLI